MSTTRYTERPREEIRSIRSTIVPAVTAIAVAIMLLGVATSWWLVIPGGLIFAGAAGKWIADVRNETKSLPR